MDKKQGKKKVTARQARQSLTIGPSIRVVVSDGYSDDVIRENIKVWIRDFVTRCFQESVCHKNK